jgi:hypothetical protein
MKKYFYLLLIPAALALIFANGCEKTDFDAINMNPGPAGPRISIPPDSTIITSSFTEEFKDMAGLISSGKWTAIDNEGNLLGNGSTIATWSGGWNSTGKGDTTYYGFTAYSYDPSWNQDQYAYSYVLAQFDSLSFSSWLLTPTLRVKNGDKISFYTRGDTTANDYTDRMQVRMNKSNSTDVGKLIGSGNSFTTLLFDINPSQTPGAYPQLWTKYEYTFSGINGTMDTRIGFCHYLINPKKARGVGIDQFKFQSN